MSAEPQPDIPATRKWIEAVLDLLPVAVLLIDPDTLGATFANQAADRMVGGRFPRGDERFGEGGAGYVPRDPATGEPLAREQTVSYLAARTGRRIDGLHLDFETPAGTLSLVASAELLPAVGDMPPTVIAAFEDVTELTTAQRVTELALKSEREARAAAEAAARRARFLAEASVLLDRSLDYDETLASVAALAVPDVADWCAVDLLDSGELRTVAVTHRDPERVELGRRLLADYPYRADDPHGPPEVVRSGRSELLADVTDEMVVASAHGPEHLELLRAMQIRSLMVVPMISRGRMLGTITFVAAESGRRFDDDDVLLAEDLARRAAVAIDNSRLYTDRAQIARTLQESLLPPQLPVIPGVELAARYLPAGEGIDVGGDFYDLFAVGDDWSIVVGDVCGKGADAAALTALARYTLRATAKGELAPSEALMELNDAVLRQRGDGRFITVAYARLAMNGDGGARLTLSTGGHPPPIVVRADGSAAPVGCPGTLLGVVPDPTLSDVSLELAPGDALFVYTDGVTEAYAPDRILEPDDMARLLEGCADGDAADLVECIEQRVRELGDGPPGDDIAMLAVRIPPS